MCWLSNGPQGSCSVGAEGCTTGVQFTNETFKEACQNWCSDPESVAETHGNISNWDVADVTDMKEAFKECQNFNEDISNWDVSNVTTEGMFNTASSFNQDIRVDGMLVMSQI